jgi:hypothetical protein
MPEDKGTVAAPCPDSYLFAQSEPDGVDDDIRAGCGLEDVLQCDQAGRVIAVRQQDHGAAAWRPRVIVRNGPAQLLQADVHRVVEGGRSAGRRLTNRLFEGAGVTREGLRDPDSAVEVDDGRNVSRLELPDKTDGGLLARAIPFPVYGCMLVAGTSVDRRAATFAGSETVMRVPRSCGPALQTIDPPCSSTIWRQI